MGTVPPTVEDLRKLAARYNLTLDDSDLASFCGLITPTLVAYDTVERLATELQPERVEREHTVPGPADNPLNAWCLRTEISSGADGPLSGRRVVLKDNIALAGVPMANGSAALEGFVPRRDATVVTRLLDAGATIVGKGNCEDLGYSAGSHTSVNGAVRNPWDPARTSGGSSSGAAVLVAVAEADLAVGGDQGGSIRIPAAFSGIVGHKPTYGLVPCTGVFPMENTLDHVGPLARTVRDAALLLEVLAGQDSNDPRQRQPAGPADYLAGLDAGVAGLRIGLLDEGFGLPGRSEPAVDDAVRAAADQLAALGASVRRISVPWHEYGLDIWTVIATDGIAWQMVDGNGLGRNWAGRYDPELISHYASGRQRHADRLSETVKLVTLNGAYTIDKYHGKHYAMAQNLVPKLIEAYDRALAEVDVLVLPTAPYVAKELPPPDAPREEYVASALGMVANTAPFDASGHPATAVPVGLAGGLPASMMIIGPRSRDELCLRVAHAYEQAVGGFPPPPPVTPTAAPTRKV